MSKKSKKRTAARVAAKTENRTADKKTPVRMKKKSIIIISVVAALLIIAFAIGLVSIILWQKDFDYLEDNLSRYVKISEKQYKGYTLELILDEVTDADVERKIMNLRYQNRGEALNNGGDAINLNHPINVGDRVKIYYRGYTVDETGAEKDFDGGSNFFDSVYSLEIGSLSFVYGFEESLVGIKPNDYPRFSYKDNGTVSAGDVIYLTYKALLPDGSTVTEDSKRIDLSAENIDAIYGIGFKDYFVGKTIGEKISESKTLAFDGGSAVYFDMTVNHATSCEQNALTIDAYFPADYQEASLRGKWAKFDVYVQEVVAYEAPEYNEAFITETLKLTADALAEYEGSSIVEKHKAMLRSEAETENAEKRKSVIEEAMWEYLNRTVKIKRLPAKEVDRLYEEYYSEMRTLYDGGYSSYYDSFDSFAAAYLGINEGADWRAYVTANAESVVAEKLLFYYIVREEGLLPTEEEYKTNYEECIQEYLNYYTEEIYNDELADIKDDALREARILEIKEEMLDYYGEEYFREIVHYNYAIDDLISYVNVVEK